MLTSEAVSSGSSVSLNVGKVANSEGIGVGDLLNFTGLLGLSCVSLFDALQSCVVVMVSIWCGVGLLLYLLLHCEVLEGLPLLLDLLLSRLEDLLLSLDLFDFLQLYLLCLSSSYSFL